ncbi:hypothetical protein [Streptomyces lutosisoli]|uniref:Uncharacterized protein n=1 Tax=Streptomyces lutosisoli TaxID=2665721 RepID=A0ABW2VV72_9ACTN
MAGPGLRARRPECPTRRPYDSEVLATEVSPVTDADLDQAGDLLVSQISQLGRGGQVPRLVVVHPHVAGASVRAADENHRRSRHCRPWARIIKGGETIDEEWR